MPKLGKYAENPHQVGWVEKDESYKGPSILNKQLHGIEMGYNNLLDANAAFETILDLKDENAVCIVKHQNPCGLATGKDLVEAFENAWAGDPVSAFGSVIAFSREVTVDVVKLLKGKFIEIIIAPSFSKETIEWIEDPENKKKSLRVIECGNLDKIPEYVEKRTIRGGEVSQTEDNQLSLSKELTNEPNKLTEPNSGKEYIVGNVTKEKFSKEMQGLIDFSIIAGKHVRSNAIVIVQEYEKGKYRLIGMGAGQPNRLESVRIAVSKAKENLGKIVPGLVLFSDAFFPKADAMMQGAEAGIKYIVSPGGSKADQEIIDEADKKGVAMIFTGMRHFKH